jgi:hypothetical protein
MSTLTMTKKAGIPTGQPKHKGCCGNCAGARSTEMEPPEVPSRCIAARAFEIFQARKNNGAVGDELSDWLEAERDLKTASQNAPVTRTPARA